MIKSVFSDVNDEDVLLWELVLLCGNLNSLCVEKSDWFLFDLTQEHTEASSDCHHYSATIQIRIYVNIYVNVSFPVLSRQKYYR